MSIFGAVKIGLQLSHLMVVVVYIGFSLGNRSFLMSGWGEHSCGMFGLAYVAIVLVITIMGVVERKTLWK